MSGSVGGRGVGNEAAGRDRVRTRLGVLLVYLNTSSMDINSKWQKTGRNAD